MRRIGTKKPAKRQRTKTLTPGKAARAHSTADAQKQLVDRLKRERDEAVELQTASAEVLKIISSSPRSLKSVFEAMLASALRICEAKFGHVLLYDGERFDAVHLHDVPQAYRTFWEQHGPIRPSPNTGLGRLARTKQVAHIPDLKADSAYAEGDLLRVVTVDQAGARTFLSVPMLKDNELVGAIVIYRQEVRPFTERQIDLMKTFADQAVIAIENARLFNETREALERQTATAEILKVIASSPSDVQPVFKAIANHSKHLIGGFSTAVFRFIDGIVHLASFTSISPEADAVLQSSFPRPIGELFLFDQAKGGEIVEEIDTETNPDPRLRDLARARGFRSTLLAPLVSSDTPIGLIVVTRKEPGRFARHHIQLLQTFADQAVIAIENARLFNEVQQRTSDLQESLQQQTATSEVLKVISRSAFDLDTVMNTLAGSARALCGSKSSSLFLRDGNMLVCRGSAAVKPEDEVFIRANPVELNDVSHMGRAVLNGTIANIGDFVNNPHTKLRKFQQAMGFRSFLAVPLMREGSGIGVFVLGRDELGPFSQRQVELVQGFADQAVIAIENVRLFDEVQARTRELSQSLDDLSAAQDRLVQTEKLASLGQLTAGIAHEIKNPLNFVNNFSALSIDLTDELNDILKQAWLAEGLRKEIDELTGMLKDNLSKVVQHGKRADSIVKNMLLHSREGSGERRSADINLLVGESLNLAFHGARAEKAGFSIGLEHDFDPSAGALDLYPQEITRALLNLISNGFYAATQRKAASDDEAFEPVVSATTRNLGKTIEIRIRDNGTGIPPEVREKMFNPFFTTKPTGEGTGLGLSMTHDIIVKQHGGRIDVETKLGEFTEFIITLPRDDRAAAGDRST
jgi:two-component system, NtrC family, sensor kinase